jgi:hypothetical protein
MVLVPIGSGTTTSASDTEQDSQSAVIDAWKAALEKAQSERSSSSLNPTTIAGAPGGDVILPPPGLGPYAPPDFGPIIFGPDVRQPPYPEYGPDIRQPPYPEYGPDVRQPPGTFGPPGTEPTPPSTEPTPLWVNYAKGKPESGETGQTGETGKAGKRGKAGKTGKAIKTKGKNKGQKPTPEEIKQCADIRSKVLRQAQQAQRKAPGQGKSGRSGSGGQADIKAGNTLIQIANNPQEYGYQLNSGERALLKNMGGRLIQKGRAINERI